jgi:hypothetical protein
MHILTNLDLNKNQVLNIILHKLTSAPANLVKGQMYFNTVSNRPFYYNGTEWVGMDALGATMTAEDIVDAINDSEYTIDIDNITGLQAALDAKETPSGAQSKADAAYNSAKSYTDTALANLVDSAPAALDTLHELAAALGDDPNFATTITNLIAQKTGKYAAAVGDGTTTVFTVTHNLSSRDIVVSIRETSSPYAQVYTDVEMTTENSITLRFAEAPSSNQYTVTVVG